MSSGAPVTEQISGKEENCEMKLQFQDARKAFQDYLKNYDCQDPKIRLKIVHTQGVVACAEEISGRKGLSEEDCELAKLIALLHDIGRFEQVRRFNSFEPATMDHASYGVQVLFEEGMIRNFIQEERYDACIRKAIARHSDFRLQEEDLTQQELLHARLIRDADKLDNCRVKIQEPLEILLGMDGEAAGATEISDGIYQAVMCHQSVLSSDRKTPMDYWVSYAAHIFDVNFRETLEIIREQDYVRRQIRRISCSNPETAEKLDDILNMTEQYIQEKLAS